jgi:prepilin-type N-terminal cleavage/methylation domain-containing protein
MSSKRLSNERGVTLIESVVALGLFAIAAAAISNLLVGHVRQKGSNLAATTAIVVAERELEDLRSLDYADIVTRSSTKTFGGLTYTLTTTVTADVPAPNMKTIQTQLTWSEPSGAKSYVLNAVYTAIKR